METLTLFDEGTEVSFRWQDLVHFHGSRSICGLAVSFKAMQCVWLSLFENFYPERDSLVIEAGFAGPGIVDGFELVTRAISRERFSKISIQPGNLVAEASNGAYYFAFSSGTRRIALGLKPEVVPLSFIEGRRKLNVTDHTCADRQNFKREQKVFYKLILDSHPLDAFNVLESKNNG